MRHVELKVAALAALNALFSDTSVTQAETYTTLEEIEGEIEIMKDSIKADSGDDGDNE